MTSDAWLAGVLTDKENWCVNYYCTTCGATPLRTSLKQKLNPGQDFTMRDVITLRRTGKLFSHEEGLQLLDQLKNLGDDYIRRVEAMRPSPNWHDWHARMRFVVMLCRDSIKADGDVVEFMQRETEGTLAGRVLHDMIRHHKAIRARYEERQRQEAENRARRQARREAHESKYGGGGRPEGRV